MAHHATIPPPSTLSLGGTTFKMTAKQGINRTWRIEVLESRRASFSFASFSKSRERSSKLMKVALEPGGLGKDRGRLLGVQMIQVMLPGLHQAWGDRDDFLDLYSELGRWIDAVREWGN